jgi:hypothetical protein|tara:strand:+ start:144 stop:539 length:396 start_codon:yes stop_codon:yes gene_type:complete
MTQHLTPNQQQWITALRSGGYTQGKGKLHSTDGFCCLGVAAKEFITSDVEVTENIDEDDNDYTTWAYDSDFDVAPDYVIKALGLYDSNGSSRTKEDLMILTNLNDKGSTFEQIADIIEANPENYFREDHKL